MCNNYTEEPASGFPKTACGHKFHNECLSAYLEKSIVCPHCEEALLFSKPSTKFFAAHEAVEDGDLERFQKVYSKELFFQAQDSVTLLELAASNNQAWIIKEILKTRVSRKEMGIVRYALKKAIQENHPKAVKAIMHHIGPLGHLEHGTGALYTATRLGRVQVVQVLLDSGVQVRFDCDCSCWDLLL